MAKKLSKKDQAIVDGMLSEGGSAIGRLTDGITGEGGARAAEKKEAAMKEAAKDGIAFLQEGAKKGVEYIDTGTEQAAGAIGTGTDQASRALAQGNQSSLAALYQGRDQAANAIGGMSNRMADLYGGGLGAGFEGDPGYQFRLQQGEDAIMRNFAARGGRGGGDAMKAIMEHGQNFASNEFGNYAQRQMGMAGGADAMDASRQGALANLYQGVGSQASGIQGQYGSNMANLATGQGSALANLYSGAGTNKANLGIGAAGQSAELGMAPAQFAGGADQARQDTFNNLMGLGVGALTYGMLR